MDTLFDEQRSGMLHAIEMEYKYTRGFTGRPVPDPRIMAVLARTPRHEFVPPEYRDQAYENRPISIGKGQTISQPFIVAIMTELLDVDDEDTVLEIGTGSGYQAAVLAALVKKVLTTEVIPELAAQARDRLLRLGYANVEVFERDGYDGLPEYAPYDAIIVTAAAREIPSPLLAQLADGGNLVIPLGRPYETQELVLYHREKERLAMSKVLNVVFVPLVSDRWT